METNTGERLKTVFTNQDCVLYVKDSFLDLDELQSAVRLELHTLNLKRNPVIRLRRRTVSMQRSVGYFVKPGSGIEGLEYALQTTKEQDMPPFLLAMCQKLNTMLRKREPENAFNAVLVNMIEDGTRTIGFHSDQNPHIDKETGIACVTFGGTRSMVFDLQNYRVELPNNTMIYMFGDSFQNRIKRRIPQRAACKEPFWLLSFHRRTDVKTPAQFAKYYAAKMERLRQEEEWRRRQEQHEAEEKQRRAEEAVERDRRNREKMAEKKRLAEEKQKKRQEEHQKREDIEKALRLQIEKEIDTMPVAVFDVNRVDAHGSEDAASQQRETKGAKRKRRATETLEQKAERWRRHAEMLRLHVERKRQKEQKRVGEKRTLDDACSEQPEGKKLKLDTEKVAT